MAADEDAEPDDTDLVADPSGSEAILRRSITGEKYAAAVMMAGGFSRSQESIHASFRRCRSLFCMKHISKLLLLVIALGFASCAHHDSTTQTSQTTTSTGYRK